MPLLHDLLLQTSRTFGLAIPLLPEPLRREVTVAYLLFRIADTLEDASEWLPGRRRAELLRLQGFLASPVRAEADALADAWRFTPPSRHTGYQRLLGHLTDVVSAVNALSPSARQVVLTFTARSAAGMADYVGRMSPDGSLRLSDIEDLRGYCYAVAGLVGEMLTELFLLCVPGLGPAAAGFRQAAPLFGEGLQLVNILKDSAEDAKAGRIYVPVGVPRSEVFALARRDLQAAETYRALLADYQAPPGLVAFVSLPIQLAWATLRRVERDGPGARLTRSEVAEILGRLSPPVS